MSIFSIALLFFAVSQFYWAWRGYRFAAARIRSRGRLWMVCALVLAVYLALYEFNLGAWRQAATPVRLTLPDALLAAPFLWWAASSLFGFFVVILFAIPQGIVGGVRRLVSRLRADGPEIPSPERRQFLGRTAAVAAGVPFVAGAYGLLYGRLNLQVTPQPIRLPRLPRAFDGFRICQLSDIHIGPFMPAEEIRKYVAIANAHKPDLAVLTGDFVTFDRRPARCRGRAPGLRAPFGVLRLPGQPRRLGGVEDTITEFFRQTRHSHSARRGVPIAIAGDALT